MTKGSAIALIGAGVAGWYFWPQIAAVFGIAAPAAAQPSSTTPSQPTASTAAPAPTTPSAAQAQAIANLQLLMASGIQQAIQYAAGNPAQATPSQWNWYMNLVTGIPAPTNLQGMPADPTATVTWATYWTGLMNWASAAAGSPTGIA